MLVLGSRELEFVTPVKQNIFSPTIGVFDLDAVGGRRWFTKPSAVLSEHAELVSAVLDQVGYVDDVGDARLHVHA